MNDDGKVLAEPRRTALRVLVMEQAQTRAATRNARRLRRFGAGVVGFAVLGGGGVLAYAELASPGVTDTTSVRCYQSANVNSNYTEFSHDDVAGGPPTNLTDPVGACAHLYQRGLLPGLFEGRGPKTVDPTRHDPVPSLVACVWPTGIAAVFPTPATCGQLGLPADLPTGSTGH